jgi:outer membrane protein, multidrug efflux system
VQISLIGDTATAWLTMAADQDLLSLASETLEAREQSLKLIRSREAAGGASMLDVRQGETLVEQARGDVAEASAQVAQDRNALTLLVGTEIPTDLLPDGRLEEVRLRTELPAGIPSEVLARRPDVLSAEYNLKAKGANIGAARAAFFPRISLTGMAGTASDNLSGLFSSGSSSWSFSPSVSIPIFDAGANSANLASARADQKIAVATYQATVQTGFREVSDALAVKATIDARVDAGTRLLVAATDAERLARARYDQGIDSFLVLLDAQRSRYSAQQSLVVLKLIQAQNLATLFRSMGGGAPA